MRFRDPKAVAYGAKRGHYYIKGLRISKGCGDHCMRPLTDFTIITSVMQGILGASLSCAVSLPNFEGVK